eukprot:scaffold5628_cov76-Skeletonema_dohrnii-CCMP3373.AAC.2
MVKAVDDWMIADSITVMVRIATEILCGQVYFGAASDGWREPSMFYVGIQKDRWQPKNEISARRLSFSVAVERCKRLAFTS